MAIDVETIIKSSLFKEAESKTSFTVKNSAGTITFYYEGFVYIRHTDGKTYRVSLPELDSVRHSTTIYPDRFNKESIVYEFIDFDSPKKVIIEYSIRFKETMIITEVNGKRDWIYI